MPIIDKKIIIQMAAILHDNKAEDIIVLDIHELTIITDYFIICSGRSITHVRGLCDEFGKQMKKSGIFCRREEGYRGGRWIVMDFNGVMLHIFHFEERLYYNLERLWMDGINLDDSINGANPN